MYIMLATFLPVSLLFLLKIKHLQKKNWIFEICLNIIWFFFYLWYKIKILEKTCISCLLIGFKEIYNTNNKSIRDFIQHLSLILVVRMLPYRVDSVTYDLEKKLKSQIMIIAMNATIIQINDAFSYRIRMRDVI